MTDPIVIYHFNDVYAIDPRDIEPVGGASRFAHVMKNGSHENALVLFSGDVFAPSLTSTITKGTHMPPLLNHMNINTACFGNHDFDFGVDQLEKLVEMTNFPWLMSNVVDKKTNEMLCHGLRKRVIEWQGRRIGMMGLVEIDWLLTLPTIEPGDVDFYDFVETGRTIAKELREVDKCDLVIALTHMRLPNDEKLAMEVPDIDMVLGGHDHFVDVKFIGRTLVAKSGTDFREWTRISVMFTDDNKPIISFDLKTVTKDIPVCPEAESIVAKFVELVGASMETIIGELSVTLDAKTGIVRTQESNLGNFICDIIRSSYNCDVVILNSGTIRSDDRYGPGYMKMKDLKAILPMEDPMVIIGLTGHQIVRALENGVSKFPVHEGRFPQVSGIRFKFDPTLPPGSRILPGSLCDENDVPLDLDKEYTVSTKHYLSKGKDGFDVFLEGRVILDISNASFLNIMVRNHFTSISVMNTFVASETPTLQRAASKFKGKIMASKSASGIFTVNVQKDGRITNIRGDPSL